MGHKQDSTIIELDVSAQDIRGIETMIRGIAAAAFYGVCSVSSAFISKSLMDTLDFDYPVIIMVTQMILTIAVLETLSLLGVISLPPYTLKRGMSFLWPALFYGVNAVLALSALSHMNIAMYGVLKRCVPLSILILSSMILKQGWPSRLIMLTVSLLCIGCIIAGYGDLTFNLAAYTCGTLSNFTQAMYLLLVQRHSQHHKLTTTETLQLNCYNSLPILLLAAVVNGELQEVWDYSVADHRLFPAVFFCAISVGMLLNYSLFLCTGLTSALTTSVVGGLKAMAQTMLGLVTFGGVSHNIPTYVGIALNLVGGIGYIAAKYGENNKKLHKEIHRVLSSTSLAQNGYVASSSKDEVNGDLVPHSSSGDLAPHDRENGYRVKERTHSERSLE
ncbi:hypothetical protein BaRGS_00010563 [Batillaria attramentaria]|uniref:Sugar phosphate transporter domain-containing protein n=1 Tax=Batillaria attramentaria TaxID=370345 RepID=A0ABD0LGQ7_9CAEN